MSVDFKVLGGLFRFRYINDVEELDIDDLQEAYAEMEEEYQSMKNDCKELKMELDKLKEAIERKNPEERREKIKKKLKTPKEILNDDEIPYEVRMKYIIDSYRKDQVKWSKLAEYTKHLEEEVIRLKNILVVNGYTDTGDPKDSNPTWVIKALKTEVDDQKRTIKELRKRSRKAAELEERLKVDYPQRKYEVGCFKKVIKSQKEYIEELQAILDYNDIPYPPKVPVNELEKEDINAIDENAVRDKSFD